MFGGDLPSNDEFTLALITNDEVLAVNQKATGSRELFSRGDQVAWVSDAPDRRSKYLAVFNVGDQGPADIRVNWSELGLPETCALRDLWERKQMGPVRGGHVFPVPSHGAGLYKLTPTQ
jgi:hypothetical protein